MIRPLVGLAAACPLRSVLRRQPLHLDVQPPSRLRSRLPFLICHPPPPSSSIRLSIPSRRHFTSSSPLRQDQDDKAKAKTDGLLPSEPPSFDTDTSPSPKTEDPIPIQNTIPPVPIWQRLGPLTTAANAYARNQRARPRLTQLVSALVIYLVADLSAQSIGRKNTEEDGKEQKGWYDPKRTVRSLIIGGISALPSYYWFLFLSHNFNYASRLLSLGTKILINLAIFTPLFNTWFFGAQAVLSGCTPSAVVDRIVYAVPPSTFNSWKFWPWVTAFSFTFVPIEYRSVFAGVISIGWQTYLAWLNRKAELLTSVAKEDNVAVGVEKKEQLERVVGDVEAE